MVEEGTAAPEASEHVRFAGFTLDVGGYTLTGPGGREVPLRRAEFALLQAFLRAPGRVLSRDHLLGSVAGRPCASYDRSVDVLVSRLRRKIEAGTGEPPLILTVPGLGYKFTGNPESVRLSSELRPWATDVPTRQMPDKPSIAVLPFQNRSGDSGQDYFADGMTEEIITALSPIPSFFVVSRHSTFAYKEKSSDVRQVGCELGVRYVLEGSARMANERVRITGQLIDAANGVHLWADRFDVPAADVFEVQDKITASVIGAIEPKLRQAEIERARRKPPDNLQAYDLLLRSRFAFCPADTGRTRRGVPVVGARRRARPELRPRARLASSNPMEHRYTTLPVSLCLRGRAICPDGSTCRRTGRGRS
jgi:TolB-like protein